MIEQYVRPIYQRLLVEPTAKNITLSPQRLTLLAAITGILIFPALYFQHKILASILLLMSGYLDTLDGTVARRTNTSSPLGAVYDILSDRMVEAAALLGLLSVDPISRSWPVSLMLASILLCVTSFLVVGVFTPNESHKSFHYSPGIMERAEAFIFFLLMIWMPHQFTKLSVLFVILVLLTTFARLRQFANATQGFQNA